jgi:hypothetical protein
MRLLAAFQDTTPLVMYPRLRRMEDPWKAALGRRSAAVIRELKTFFIDLIHLDDDIPALLP